MIPDDVIEQVRDAADIVGIIGEHVELKRTGADFRAPCPFHGGTHRNFAVIPRKGMYYCFVCHEGGDVFIFFMKKLGMDYPTAVREVARRVGIAIPERGPTGPDPREPLYEAVASAADWFARQLRESPEAQVARDYLASRHLELEIVLPLGLGYAPRSKAFLDAMKGLGVREAVLLEAGLLVKRDDGTLLPRFGDVCCFRSTISARGSSRSGAASSAKESRSISTRPTRPCSTRASCSTTCTSRSTRCARRSAPSSWKGISTCCAWRSRASRRSWPRSAPALRRIRRSYWRVMRRP